MYEVLLISLVMETYSYILLLSSTKINGGQLFRMGGCVQYNHMFSDNEHNKIMNVRVYDKIMK